MKRGKNSKIKLYAHTDTQTHTHAYINTYILTDIQPHAFKFLNTLKKTTHAYMYEIYLRARTRAHVCVCENARQGLANFLM